MIPHSTPAFDRPALLENLGGDTELLRQIIGIFQEHYTRDLDALDRAVAAREVQAVARQAHALKGVVGNFMAFDAFESARALEAAAVAGNQERLGQLAEELHTAVAALAAALQEELLR